MVCDREREARPLPQTWALLSHRGRILNYQENVDGQLTKKPSHTAKRRQFFAREVCVCVWIPVPARAGGGPQKWHPAAPPLPLSLGF